ncbi:MAG: hypothetical protein COA99_05900 [Moraxellaceae bacterium]|nr:MAG: hypothetical protein COA99_05900 [Moraxellaceae bacterium]
MQINLLNEEKEESKEFLYYSQDGVYLGRSEGRQPDQQLLEQAHYVFDSDNDIVKNLDILGASRKRLTKLRKELISVPIKDMGRILDINQQIKRIEEKIDNLEQSIIVAHAS